jgi:5-formyltetrahydrofolate cyclo-ligase
MSISDRKSELRAALLKERLSIPKDDWKLNSRLIFDRLKELDEFKQARIIHTFVSLNERNEVDTHDLIKELLIVGKKVFVPVTNFETGELDHSELTYFGDLELNKWGVPEPKSTRPLIEKLDIILVPLLGADESFNRLGYGKGFYDKFLQSAEALKIGLIFDEFIQSEIPVDDFDEKLDILITEKRILRRNNR